MLKLFHKKSKTSGSQTSAWALFSNPEFSRLWCIGALSNTTRWLELLAIGVFVFDLTGSAFDVAMMTLLRIVPFALFGLVTGALTQHFPYRSILRIGVSLMVSVTLILGTLSMLGLIQLWHIAIGTFLSGTFWVVDFTVRRTSIGESVQQRFVGQAMGLDALTNNGTRILGPAMAGLLLQWLGLTGVYLLSGVAYVGALLFTASLSSIKVKTVTIGMNIRASIVGARDVLTNHPPLTGLLISTLVLNLWGLPFVSMIPVIGRDVLSLNPFYVGLLMSAEGCGALIGALLITSIRQQKYYRRFFVIGIFLYLGIIVAFSQSRFLPYSVGCLFVVGIGVAILATMQSSLVILISPKHARGLIMGILSMCIGLGAPIGLIHIGLMADWVGPPQAIAILACEGILAFVLVIRRWPSLWHLQIFPTSK
ncbi:MAG: hypothetical protein CL398_03935 [Acidiferrobacteraceae bacterium]|nr:hypothetical protein [Acidiferrobacteraceae bacterium]